MTSFAISLILSSPLTLASQSLIDAPQETAKIYEVIEFRAIADHHFNIEAPQKCGEFKPIEKTPQSIKCQFAAAGKKEVLLNICDDEKTFCKPEKHSLEVENKTAASNRLMKTPEKLLSSEAKESELAGLSGFKKRNWEEALGLKKPQLVVVSAKWCPPCNALKDFTFSQDEFKTAFADFPKTYVDGDSPIAQAFSENLSYYYYPSLILLNAKGEEIDRLTDFHTAEKLSQWLKETKDLEVIAKVKKRVQSRKEGSLFRKVLDLFFYNAQKKQDELRRVAHWNQNLGNKEIATAQFNELGDEKSQLENKKSRFFAIHSDKEKKEEWKSLGLDLIQNSPQLESQVAQLLCRSVEAEECRSEILNHFEARLLDLKNTADPNAVDPIMQIGAAHYSLAKIYQSWDERQSQQMARNCVRDYEKLNSQAASEHPRFVSQRKLYCLKLTGHEARYLAQLERTIQRHPFEPTFLKMKINYLEEKKLWSSVVYETENAIKVSYGRDYLALNYKKANALKEMGQTEKARQAIQTVLAEVDPPKKTKTAIHRYLQKLRKLQMSL